MSDLLKQQVGEAALDYLHDGMKLGIGTGSTAEAFIRALAVMVAEGFNVVGVPTSERTAALCRELDIPLTTLAEAVELDLTIDGADEIDPSLNLIKGAGGALLREKIVAFASKQMLVIGDESKLVSELGAFPLPIEINQFGLSSTCAQIERVAGNAGLSTTLAIRETSQGEPYITDGGHLIVDASFGRIDCPEALAQHLVIIPGVVETGLFTGLATEALIAGANGVQKIKPCG